MPEVSEESLIETLMAYTPGLVVRGLAADPRQIAEPTAERFAAAVLFADVSGFTAMGERLAKHGLIGAEELALLLNRCFGGMIDIIHHYGGEVTKFAGDAVLALWPVSDDVARLSHEAKKELTKMAARAAQCGLAMQRALLNNDAAEKENLSLQVGIGAGDVYSIHLGGVFDRWEFLLSGSPLVQISQAKDQAVPGKVVLSPEVWELVEDRCSGNMLKNGFVQLEKVKNPVATRMAQLPGLTGDARQGLLAYIPAAVTNRLTSGHEAWLSEMRQVTVMFIKLPSYGTSITHPYARTLPKAQAVMQALQTKLYYYAGSINKLNVDDKGITLVAGLGLPPLAHKDDAARAVHAALEMQAALKELGRSSAIGITTGYVFCGPIGNERRKEYTMVGNVVNMSARLMQAAETNLLTGAIRAGEISSDILVDERTYHIVQEQVARGQELASRLSFERLPLIHVKGKAEAVPVFRPSYRKVSRGRQHPGKRTICFGREVEQAILHNMISDWKNEKGENRQSLYFIEGESGIGKTLMLEDLAKHAEQHHIPVLAGLGRALDRTVSYHAWRPVFHQIFKLDDVFHDPPTLRAHVTAQLPTLRNERGFPGLALRLSALLNPIFPFDFPESDLTRSMDEAERRQTTQLLLLRLIENEVKGRTHRSNSPYLLIMDSGQWLDPESWELLRLVSKIPNLLVVVATRPLHEEALAKPLVKACRLLLSSEGVNRITVSLLSGEQITEMLCRKEQIAELPEVITAVLNSRTGGHPLYSEELIAYWQTNNLVRKNGNGFEVLDDPQRLVNIPVPERIQKAITGRLDNLPPMELLILKTASTIGVNFTLNELINQYPLKREASQLAEGLINLEQLQFIRRTGSGDYPAYTFVYGLVREVANSLLSESFRRQILEGKGQSLVDEIAF